MTVSFVRRELEWVRILKNKTSCSMCCVIIPFVYILPYPYMVTKIDSNGFLIMLLKINKEAHFN